MSESYSYYSYDVILIIHMIPTLIIHHSQQTRTRIYTRLTILHELPHLLDVEVLVLLK